MNNVNIESYKKYVPIKFRVFSYCDDETATNTNHLVKQKINSHNGIDFNWVQN